MDVIHQHAVAAGGACAGSRRHATLRSVFSAHALAAALSFNVTAVSAADTTPPTVAITAPASGSIASGTVTVTASAADNVGVVGVQFKYNGINSAPEVTAAPYTVTGDTTTVPNGSYTLTAIARDAAGNRTTSGPVMITVANGASPYTGAPIAVPGTFEAENFDRGGEGVAYHDSDKGNAGGQYRNGEDVDIIVSPDTPGGGYVVNNFATKEWLTYTVNVAATGQYDIEVRASTTYSTSAFHAEIDGKNVTGSVTVPNTASWSTFQWSGKKGVTLAAGKHLLRIVADQQFFNLNSIRVVATVTDTVVPSVPTGLTAAAVSPSQINLSWNSSTDNVGVKGYYVYLNDVALATTTTTSFQHTGLTAGTTYKYRVSAYDAVPNDSAWTATPLAVTTPTGSTVVDTIAPSVPTGLTATAVSSNQINLSWNAATDNVGVTGYYVYLNDAALATTTTTSFQHTGLAAGGTYNYRVSAYDAVPNHSAWTATPVPVTTPAPAGGVAQTITFSGTTEEFPNPERGLSKLYENLTNLNASWLVAHRDAGYRLVTHRQKLSSYVYTTLLPQSFLDALNAGAALHRANGTKMAMQFSYDNVGGGPEPALTTVLAHIAQLKPFFTANADVIASVHGGFLGTYGEWAFSTEPSVGNPTPTAAARAAVRDELLAAVDKSTPIGWRTVDDLSKWYPTPLNVSQAFNGTPQSRSGIHNDCFLSNKDDSGTYWRAGVADTGRTLSNPFRAYHAQASDFTTMGGENCGDGQYKACADVLYDGATYHWRYLRDDWGTVFHDGWKAQGCYPEIKRSLGYRFQLDALTHPASAARGAAVSVEVDLRNLGWARILSARQLVVTLKHRTSGALIQGGAGDMRLIASRGTSSTRVVVAVAIPADAGMGDYDVYVGMPDIWPGTKDKADFAIRFANADDPARGQAWEAANFRFKTGTRLTITP